MCIYAKKIFCGKVTDTTEQATNLNIFHSTYLFY